MSAVEEHFQRKEGQLPALWHEPAPRHFDQAVAWWFKAAVIVAAVLISIRWLDYPIAHRTLATRPIPDLFDPQAKHNDIARELMLLEQWGQWVCSALVIMAVAMLDPRGRRRALAIALGCLCTVLLTYVLKDVFGRSRPMVFHDGTWQWGGPAMGFVKGAEWGSFPSAHTTGAFALSVGLSWFYPRARGLFMGLAVMTAVQRVLHSAHFLSDVIAGMGLSVLVTRWSLRAKLAGRFIARMPAGLREWMLRDSGS
ncbi:MAG TPA: phosphatase PAP2 family protein [Phycisphaerae bacterium]|nr:phosphatase PAP2 family protein [Phycisphaerae bacterium]